MQLWEAHDEQLAEVLPSEVLGRLLLRRAGLSSQQRLSVQAAAGNSLKLEAIERALRGMEEELLQNKGYGKGGRDPPRRRTYWVEEAGHWSLLLGEASELDDIVDGGETLCVGERLFQQAYSDSSAMWSSMADGWQELDSPQSSWWAASDGQDAWSEEAWWNDEPDFSDLTPDEQKEVDEAFAVAEQKMRNFVQARQAVKARTCHGVSTLSPPTQREESTRARKAKEKGSQKAPPLPEPPYFLKASLVPL